jgi:hypothetical protein
MLALPDMPIRRVRMGGPASALSLISRVLPKYPEEARQNRVSGTVRMHAIIATDALRKCRYRPATLDGQPVEIDTVVDMISP